MDNRNIPENDNIDMQQMNFPMLEGYEPMIDPDDVVDIFIEANSPVVAKDKEKKKKLLLLLIILLLIILILGIGIAGIVRKNKNGGNDGGNNTVNAVVSVDDLTAGDKTYVVEYSGDGNFSANHNIMSIIIIRNISIAADSKVTCGISTAYGKIAFYKYIVITCSTKNTITCGNGINIIVACGVKGKFLRACGQSHSLRRDNRHRTRHSYAELSPSVLFITHKTSSFQYQRNM